MNAPFGVDSDDLRYSREPGLDGIRATIAELHVHRALLALDPTARHVGGNHAIRDHELFDNTAWVNTKSAWASRDPDLLAFSSVNWAAARSPARPDRWLDAVALVMIGADDLRFRSAFSTHLEVTWHCHGWWLVPAVVLHDVSHSDGRSTARSHVRRSAIAEYLVGDHLTLPELHARLGVG